MKEDGAIALNAERRGMREAPLASAKLVRGDQDEREMHGRRDPGEEPELGLKEWALVLAALAGAAWLGLALAKFL